MSVPGWGIPVNQPPGERIHWWNPLGKRACGSDATLVFVGPKLEAEPAFVCPGCLVAVLVAQEVLGEVS